MSDEFVRWEGKWGDDHERAYQLGYKAAEKVMSAIKDAALAALRGRIEALIDEGEEATKLTITSGDLSKMLREILRGEP